MRQRRSCVAHLEDPSPSALPLRSHSFCPPSVGPPLGPLPKAYERQGPGKQVGLADRWGWYDSLVGLCEVFFGLRTIGDSIVELSTKIAFSSLA